LGKDKGRNKSKTCREERRNYSCWAKAAFPVDESSMGGKKKRYGQVSRSIRTAVSPFLSAWPFAEEEAG
jgi:hypothetical protein